MNSNKANFWINQNMLFYKYEHNGVDIGIWLSIEEKMLEKKKIRDKNISSNYIKCGVYVPFLIAIIIFHYMYKIERNSKLVLYGKVKSKRFLIST